MRSIQVFCFTYKSFTDITKRTPCCYLHHGRLEVWCYEFIFIYSSVSEFLTSSKFSIFRFLTYFTTKFNLGAAFVRVLPKNDPPFKDQDKFSPAHPCFRPFLQFIVNCLVWLCSELSNQKII